MFSVLHQYNVSITMTGQRAAKLGFDPYDPAKTTVMEDRFYLHRNELIRWLDNDKKEILKQDKRFKEKLDQIK